MFSAGEGSNSERKALRPIISKGSQADIVARESPERSRQVRQRLPSLVFQRHRRRVGAVAGTEHAVDDQALVREAERPKLRKEVRAASAFAPISRGHEDDGRQRRIAERRHRRLETSLLRLKAGMRPQARCALIVAFEKAAPRLREAKEPKRVSGRGVSKTI